MSHSNHEISFLKNLVHTPFKKIHIIIILLAATIAIVIGISNIVLSIILLPPLVALILLTIFQRVGIMPIIPSKAIFKKLPSGYKDITELIKIFKNSDEFVDILSGELDHHVWNNDLVIDEMKNTINRGVHFSFVCGPHFDVDNIRLAKFANEGKVDLYKLNKKEKDYHFRVNDKLDVLYHAGEDHNKNIFIYYNNSFLGRSYIKYVKDKMDHNADKISPGEFYLKFERNLIQIDEFGERIEASNQKKGLLLAELNN